MVRNSRGGYDSGDTPMDLSKMPKVPTGPAPGAMPKRGGYSAAHEGSWYALVVLREHLEGLGPEQAHEGESHTAFALRMVQHQAVKDAIAVVEKAVYPVAYVNPTQPDRLYDPSTDENEEQ